jgi:poly(3-hydroxybutyrate) depolymerase
MFRALVFVQLAALAASFHFGEWGFTGRLNLEYKGAKRLYHLIFPPDYELLADKRFPAIMMLHGNGNNASVFAALTTITRIAPSVGYVMIFPEGVQDPTSVLPSHERSWNAGTCCGEAVMGKVDDMTFLKETLKHATANFRIDSDRIFLSGASNGGSLTVRAACELGKEYFAAAAADVASMESVRGEHCSLKSKCAAAADGYYYCPWDQTKEGCAEAEWIHTLPTIYACKKKTNPLPIIFFNGNKDQFSSALLPGYPNNSGLVSYPVNGSAPRSYNTTFPPLSYVSSHFAKINGCNLSVAPRLSFRNGTLGNATACHTWAGCKANVTLCLSDAGHTWFGDIFNHSYSHAVCEYETGGPPNDAQCQPPQPGAPGGGGNTYSINETDQTLRFFEAIARIHGT